MNNPEVTVTIEKVRGGSVEKKIDLLAVEEPLEIRVTFGGTNHREQKNISVTMRTPGKDKELALGFLFNEGIITSIADIEEVEIGENVIDVQLNPTVKTDLHTLQRNFYTTSSCGVCGKASIDAVMTKVPRVIEKSLLISAKALITAQEEIKRHQQLFNSTGGIHASVLVNRDGSVELIREDVGRHNALDKLIGVLVEENRLPISNRFVFLSGRAGFELIQKAAMAGVQIVAAVGAPSSLAVEFASECGMTLLGFVRDDTFNIYCGADRIRLS